MSIKLNGPLESVLSEWRIWTHLGWRDVRVRYSRTILGPWWSAANLLTLVMGSSLAVGLLTQEPALAQAPRLALALSFWLFFSSCLIEAVDLFEVEKSLLLNSQVAEASLIARLIWRNYLIYLHGFTVVILTFLIAQSTVPIRLLAVPLLAGVFATGMFFLVYLFARTVLVLRDLKVVLPSSVQLAFFLTPVLWTPPDTGLAHSLYAINPAGRVIEFLREFVFESAFILDSFLVLLLMCTFAVLLFALSGQSINGIRKQL